MFLGIFSSKTGMLVLGQWRTNINYCLAIAQVFAEFSRFSFFRQ
jgi:hypothetical protein